MHLGVSGRHSWAVREGEAQLQRFQLSLKPLYAMRHQGPCPAPNRVYHGHPALDFYWNFNCCQNSSFTSQIVFYLPRLTFSPGRLILSTFFAESSTDLETIHPRLLISFVLLHCQVSNTVISSATKMPRIKPFSLTQPFF